MTNKEAKRILQFCIPTKTDKQRTAINLAIKALEEKPRGTWIKADIVTFGAFYDWIYKCSICDGHSKGTTNYCPYCGALMEKEETT